MKKPSDQQNDNTELFKNILGLGETSYRKSYYPELKEKLAYLERYKALLDHSNDAIFLFNVPSGHFLDVSENACRLIGYTIEECLTKTMYDLIPDKDELDKIISGKTESLVLDTVLRRSSSKEAPSEINMSRIRFGGKDYVVAIARDISRRKQAENELRDAKTQAELYLDLMSHDINNINQMVMGFLEMADDKLQRNGKLSKEDEELITTPIKVIKNSSRLIENLMKIQKEKMHTYKIEPISIKSILTDVVNQFLSVAGRDVNIDFKPAGDCIVHANLLLTDVFSNIVDNAIKHTKGPLTIGITTSVISLDSKRYCRIVIEDNGPGIPDKHKTYLFDFSVNNRQKNARRGLGLYLVKTLLDEFMEQSL